MQTRRAFLSSSAALLGTATLAARRPQAARPPNILLCISDDQSWLHTGAGGDAVVRTPGFDRVAEEGVRFTHAFCDAPTCGPSRSALVTGQRIWRLEEAGNIHSTLPAKFATYPEMLEQTGYAIGHMLKGWSPPGGRPVRPMRRTALGASPMARSTRRRRKP